MKLTITRHNGFPPAPADAVALLWPRLEDFTAEDLAFTLAGAEISARASDDPPLELTRDEWLDKCRRLVLEIVGEVCERSPALDCDWYAVSGE